MIKLPQTSILMIGSNAKGAGKTDFICRVINKFESEKIICVKWIPDFIISDLITWRADLFNPPQKNDTQKMLNAGAFQAWRAFYNQKNFNYQDSMNFEPDLKNTLMIWETTGLRSAFIPDIFLLIDHRDSKNEKSYYKKLTQYADKIIQSKNEKEIKETLDNIKVIDNHWIFNKE